VKYKIKFKANDEKMSAQTIIFKIKSFYENQDVKKRQVRNIDIPPRNYGDKITIKYEVRDPARVNMIDNCNKFEIVASVDFLDVAKQDITVNPHIYAELGEDELKLFYELGFKLTRMHKSRTGQTIEDWF